MINHEIFELEDYAQFQKEMEKFLNIYSQIYGQEITIIKSERVDNRLVLTFEIGGKKCK